MDSVAKKNSAPMYVFPTHSTDSAKNPLPHGLKVAYMKKMYKKYAKNIQISKARNVFEVAKVLHDKGHKAIIMVVGSDRVSEFSNLLDKYNGVESTHGYYGFDNIEVISAGERDPDAEGVSGMSASKMRAAAADGDKDSFLKGIPSVSKMVINYTVMFVRIWVFVKIVIWEICQTLNRFVMHISQERYGMLVIP